MGLLSSGDRAGSFSIDHELGAGGFGTVYAATHAETGAPAAVKVLHADLVRSPDAVRRFEREVDVVRRIGHPNMVDIFEVGTLEDGRPFFAMEYLEGCDLDSRLRREGRLSPAQARTILEAVGAALAAAHDADVVHRDVKASNVFFESEGRILLLDFGVAKVEVEGEAGLTTSWQVLGTPAYRAPEQIGKRADSRSDIYALGALAFHMLTGEPPFSEPSATVVQYLHRHARRPRPSRRGGVEPAFDEVVVRAMSARPADRYQSVESFLAAFAAAEEAGRRPEPAAGGAPRAPTVRSLAVHVDLEVRGAARAEEEAILDDSERVLAAAERWLSDVGFEPAVRASRTLVLARPLSGDAAEDRDARCGALEVASDLVAGTAGRAVAVRVTLHEDFARLEDGRLCGGPLFDLGAWAGGREGLFSTRSFEEGAR